MTDILIGVLLILGLVVLLMIPNIKIVRKNEVMIIERLGRFHRMLDQPGIYIIVPLVDRSIQTVSLEKQTIHKKLNIMTGQTTFQVEINYSMTITDAKTFIYGSIDSNETVHIYIKEALEALMDKEDIMTEAVAYAKEYGFLIESLDIK